MQSPNIIFLTSHDTGRHLGCYGLAGVRSPHLDALSEQGTRCTHAFATTPICSPARAALATGRYPHSNGVMGLIHQPFGWSLSDDELHLARRLQAEGYEASLIGLLHETSDLAMHGMGHSLSGLVDAAEVAETAEAFVAGRQKQSKPFYLQIGFFETHRGRDGTPFGPYEPEPLDRAEVPAWMVDDAPARQEFAQLQGALVAMDQAIGRIMAALDANGLADNTIVLYAADHGLPFARAKSSLYEAGSEIAMLWRWPDGGIGHGQPCDALINGVDVVPTLMDLLGLEPDPRVQGRSIAEALRGGTVPDAPVFTQTDSLGYRDPSRAVRTRTQKLILHFSATKAFYESSQQRRPLTTPRFTPDPWNTSHPQLELYDLENDPLETNNLADDPVWRPQRDTLLQVLARQMDATGDYLLTQDPVEPFAVNACKLLLQPQ